MNDPQHCPACGALNQCALADPRSATQACWCYAVTIDPAVLQALPAELRNKACLCPRCAQVLEQLAEQGKQATKHAPINPENR
ncbi:cysteine-rich CWC family protein [Pseudomonas faucium]|uniref:cysteine-rich CWC family protein n=1 Tax=Pseudomonas faucium TaxID=2740518 RepID=UPI001F1C6ED2|nr:cysteine-rich CWC family protein [Pseudomonas faucium]